ncbi:hypothetical protein O2V63_20180 [Modestobacter sp. VKM Ac-2977]|nr:hypothetical protein [Modestobacter sp. VKM Ac-2977]
MHRVMRRLNVDDSIGTSLIRAAHNKRAPAQGGELGRLTEALR